MIGITRQNALGRSWKLWFVVVLIAAAAVVVCCKLVRLHLFTEAQEPKGYSLSKVIPAARGAIYDANGDSCPLAVSIPVWEYRIDPKAINAQRKHTPETVSSNVAAALKLPYDEVLAKFRRTDSRYIPLAVSYDDEAHSIIGDPKLVSGVSIEERQVRRYPQGRRMSHVVGFVNALSIGCAGIELAEDRNLTGIPGTVEGVRDARNNEIYDRRKLSTEPIPGADVYLTLDHNIQREAEIAICDQVSRLSANAGWVIVQRVKDGAIVAMASCPDFDPMHYNDPGAENRTAEDCWKNRAVSFNYEPGSMMKSLTVAAALNEKIVTPDTVFDAYMGSWEYAGRIIHDHPTGKLTVRESLVKSSNIVTAKIGLLLTPMKLYTYLRAFGLGGRTGIDLPGEECGILRNWKNWDNVTCSRVPFGQGVTVTAIQMCNAYTMIANDGVLLKPFVISKIVDSKGEVIRSQGREVVGRPIRVEVARQMREMLSGVTRQGGTAKRAQVKGYTVAGKTGTAQKTINGKVSSTDYYASFCGMIPASRPEFVILVTLDAPEFKGPHTGGNAAAPVFQIVADYLMRYYEILPDVPAELEERRR